MERISVLSIMISEKESVSKVNEILHAFSDFIVGRLGIPLKEKNISVICVVLDCNSDTLGSIAGKLGMVKGVKSQALTSK